MNMDSLLLQYENYLYSIKICCNQYYDNLLGFKICNKCSKIVLNYCISPYLYHYDVLSNFLQYYYIPEFKELNKLGLILWTEFLISDLLNETNMYNTEITISDFTKFPRKYLIKIIYVYLIKNNIIDNSYL